MKKFLIPISLFIVLAILLVRGLSLDPHKIPSPLVGKPLPAFRLPALENPKNIITNEDLRNRVVVINVWASWCVTCKQEHSVLMELARRRLAPIIGLNYKDTRTDAIAVLKNEGNPYEASLMDSDGRTGIDWGVYGVPETFILDKNGVIRYKHIGAVTPEDLEQQLLPLIKNLLL
ncbi:MAG TPA: DsbE family thiol:disulfide interchange protein [Acidiferrobacterales bacterium]|nr:DsbE family thiol:disulfide interchange protein [Acidiferrobacterales bacterium]